MNDAARSLPIDWSGYDGGAVRPRRRRHADRRDPRAGVGRAVRAVGLHHGRLPGLRRRPPALRRRADVPAVPRGRAAVGRPERPARRRHRSARSATARTTRSTPCSTRDGIAAVPRRRSTLLDLLDGSRSRRRSCRRRRTPARCSRAAGDRRSLRHVVDGITAVEAVASPASPIRRCSSTPPTRSAHRRAAAVVIEDAVSGVAGRGGRRVRARARRRPGRRPRRGAHGSRRAHRRRLADADRRRWGA